MNVECSLLVKRIAVAMSSRRWRAFMQNSRLMYQYRTCWEEEEWREDNVAEVRGILLTVVFYWIKRLLRYWVVWLSILCIKLSRKVFLLEETCVGWSNSVRISLIVSMIDRTSMSDTRFSGKVGSAGCVDFPVLRNVSQDVMRFIVDVIFYRVTASRHHLRKLFLVPTRLQR
jgi:hypothetical protein